MSLIIGRYDLKKHIAQKTKLTQKQSGEALDAALTAIREALEGGNEVRLVGFGSFKVRRTTARKGTNPHTREAMQVPAKDRVRFSSGKELTEAITK